MTKKLLFEEKQRFGGWYLSSIVVLVIGLILYLNYDFIDSYTILNIFCILFVCMLGIAFSFMSLHTQIYENHIRLRVAPFPWLRYFYFNRVSSISVGRYTLFDYGGWGIKIGRNRVAYTVKGRYGIRLKTHNGKQFLIGSQRPEKIQEVLENIKNKYPKL